MDDKLYHKIWCDALEQPDKELFLAEYGYPEWFNDISENMEDIMRILGEIHDIAWISLREIISRSGMTQTEFSDHFCIPKRSIEQWSTGKRNPSPWIKKMLVEKLKAEGYM